MYLILSDGWTIQRISFETKHYGLLSVTARHQLCRLNHDGAELVVVLDHEGDPELMYYRFEKHGKGYFAELNFREDYSVVAFIEDGRLVRFSSIESDHFDYKEIANINMLMDGLAEPFKGSKLRETREWDLLGRSRSQAAKHLSSKIQDFVKPIAGGTLECVPSTLDTILELFSALEDSALAAE